MSAKKEKINEKNSTKFSQTALISMKEQIETITSRQKKWCKLNRIMGLV